MAYCSNCGAYLPDGETVCVACGAVTGSASASGASQAASQAQPSSTPSSEDLRRELEEKQKKQQEEKLRQLRQELKNAEALVEKSEELLKRKEEELASAGVYSDPAKAARVSGEYKKLREDLDRAYAAWEEAEEKLDLAVQGEAQEEK